MATSGTRRLQQSSLSSKRSQRTIETIEAYIGRAFGSDTSDYSSSEEVPSEQKLGNNNKGSMDQTN